MSQPRHRATTARDRHARAGAALVSRLLARTTPSTPSSIPKHPLSRRTAGLVATALSITAVSVAAPLLATSTAPGPVAAHTAGQTSPQVALLAPLTDFPDRSQGASRSGTRSLTPLVTDAADHVAAARQRQLRLAVQHARQQAAAAEKHRLARIAARKAARHEARVAARQAAAAQAAAEAAAQAQAQAAADAAAIPAGSLKAVAHQLMLDYGFGPEQWQPLDSLITRESGWNVHAQNGSSGAYGLPQALPGSKMASAGADWQNNARTQLTWMFGYIKGRYGTPANAWAHSQSTGWY